MASFANLFEPQRYTSFGIHQIGGEDLHKHLDATNLSYRFVSKKLSPTDPEKVLVYEVNPHPDGKRCVLFTDISVMRLTEEEFFEVLEAQGETFGEDEAEEEDGNAESEAEEI